MKLELFNPLAGSKTTQPFGVNWGADYPTVLKTLGHPGRDIAVYIGDTNVSYGRPVKTACNGEIISIEEDSRGGWSVVQITDTPREYRDGNSYFKIVYSHCIKDSFRVKKGDKVKIGDTLALCGATGIVQGQDLVIKAHVHFGVKPSHFVQYPPDEGYWANTEQDNGFNGAIDDTPYWKENFSAEQYLTFVGQLSLIAQSIAQLFFFLKVNKGRSLSNLKT